MTDNLNRDFLLKFVEEADKTLLAKAAEMTIHDVRHICLFNAKNSCHFALLAIFSFQ